MDNTNPPLRAKRRGKTMEIWIVTGLSGSGKTNALKILEDWNFFCIDNLPPEMLADAAAMIKAAGNIRRLALGVDIRSRMFFERLMPALEDLEKREGRPKILFLDADNPTLINRYKETRHRHPLASKGKLPDSIRAERTRLDGIRNRADVLIDTSNLKLKELKEALKRRVYPGRHEDQFRIHLISFGYKFGIPMDADLLMDVRFLPNPHYIPELRKFSGKDAPVSDYVMGFEASGIFFKQYYSLLTYLIPNYIEEGKTSLVIGIGCTGGHHRSVTLAEKLFAALVEDGFNAAIYHRDIRH